VTIRLAASYPKIILRIEDDGQGFDVKDGGEIINERQLGLNNIEERVKLLAGLMKIQSFTDIGTKLYIEIPFTERLDAH
jgi:signal transduction histidine kinase